ncbi:MAG: PAS domain S-box protein [Rhodanobacter sp.]
MTEMQDSPHVELATCHRELKAVRGRLRHLESLFTHIADPIFVTELDGRIIDLNPAASTAWGYTRDELVSFHLWDLVLDTSKDEILDLVESRLPGVPVTLQCRCRTKSGDQPIMDLSLVRCVLEERMVIVVTCRDVTTLCLANEQLESALAAVKESEERLQRNEAYLAEAQRLSRTGSFGWNVATGDLFWSAETFCIVGYSRETTPTLDLVFQRIHPEDIALVRQTIDHAAQDGTNLDFQHRLVMPDGAVKHVHVLAQPAGSSTGTLEFIGALMDITDRKRVEEALCRSEAYLTEAQKLSGTGSWCLRVASQELISSAQTVRIGGWEDGTTPSLEQALERVHPDDRSRVQATLEKALQDESFLEYEHRLLLPDGTIRHVHTVANPMHDASGQLEFVGAVIDITEKKKSEDALHAAAEALRLSEHLARGQLAALARTLDSLAQEFDPDQLPKHVVTTILTQMNAHSVTVWERNADMLDILGVVEGGHFKTSIEAGYFGGSISISKDAPPLWGDALQVGMHFVIEDISRDPARIILADGRTAAWMTAELPRPFADLKTYFITSGVSALLIAPMMMAGELVGIIGIRFTGSRVFEAEEIELTKALAHQATLAIRLMRLSQQSREAAVLAERNRMARDIHDTLAQGFTGVIVQLEAAKGTLVRHDDASTSMHIELASELARASLREARRSVRALRPRSLRNANLCAALEDLLKKMTEGVHLQATFQVIGQERVMPAQWEEDLLRIAQEALTNTIKHGQARNFRIMLRFGQEDIELQLVDDGRGFDMTAEHDGFGLMGMKERVERMKGGFTIRSTPGHGTEVGVILRIPADE